jgi:hypothetical protein
MLLENLIQKVDVYKKTVQSAGENILGESEQIDKSEGQSGLVDFNFFNYRQV